ncbi:hypothetical protein AURDEDRAFT_166521 [Auricularia subglabra TFB-10046 SS5]|nr:hypothetical protein AURDEDRAFT_166521 [Auricularia subglabra TFB-10046 SS5]
MRFAYFALAALVVPAQAFIAWSGDHCDGSKGNDVACDDRCRQFATRHSLGFPAPA